MGDTTGAPVPHGTPASMFDLHGKVALITGGSRGLGREMVRAFATSGADVVIASRNLENCATLATEIVETTGQRAVPIGCHVGRWEDLTRLVEVTYAEFARVDVLVNNAGTAPLYPSLAQVSEELFDKVVAVNLKAPFRLSVLVGEQMRADGGGAIVNISSLASERPTPADIPYAAAKAGLNSLTAGFAVALGPTVRVNAILVGPFKTDIANSWDLEIFEAHAAAHYPLGRLGVPREIVGTALYLASDASSFTTGTVLRVDGGIAVAPPFPT